MSNSSTNNLMNLSLDELKKILSQEKQKVRKDYKEMEEKIKVITKINKVRELGNKIKKGKVKSKVVTKKVKTFEDYLEECIINRKIPKDTPSYLRKALERVLREYQQGIEMEKSSLDGFAKKIYYQGYTRCFT